MSFHESNSAGLKRRIAMGEKVIARQRLLIERLQERRMPTEGASRLLDLMLDTQRTLLEHAVRLERQALRDKPNLGR